MKHILPQKNENADGGTPNDTQTKTNGVSNLEASTIPLVGVSQLANISRKPNTLSPTILHAD